jgi:hypothetical protein
VGVAGSYFGFITLRSRELSYQVNPTKTAIVKSGQSSDLHVSYKGENVSTDVTALQVVVWNNGKESIRSENVLTPFTVSTAPKVAILEARIKQVNRPVTQVALDTSQIANGLLGVNWKILEHNDGAMLQLIVAGPTSVTLKAEGIIEGQEKIRPFEYTDSGFHLLLVVVGVAFMVQGVKIVKIGAKTRFGKWFGFVLGCTIMLGGLAYLTLFVGFHFTHQSLPSAFR